MHSRAASDSLRPGVAVLTTYNQSFRIYHKKLFELGLISIDIGVIDTIRGNKPKRLPLVLAKEETKKIISLVPETKQSMLKLLLGCNVFF